MMEVVRLKLETPAEACPYEMRWDEATDTVQQLVDIDGTPTWVDADELDPRHINQFPALTPSEASKCDAAARVAAALEELVTSITDAVCLSSDITFIADLILDKVAPASGFGLLFAKAIAAAAEFLAAGCSVMTAGFAAVDWDIIKCRIYCETGFDGRLTYPNWAELRAIVWADYSLIVRVFFEQVMDIWGEGGQNDIAATRTETGDCDDCPGTQEEFIVTFETGGYDDFAMLYGGVNVAGYGYNPDWSPRTPPTGLDCWTVCRVTLPDDAIANEISCDCYGIRQVPADGVGRTIIILDESLNVLHTYAAGAVTANGTWTHISQTALSVVGAKYVDFYSAMGTSGSATSPHETRIDNCRVLATIPCA